MTQAKQEQVFNRLPNKLTMQDQLIPIHRFLGHKAKQLANWKDFSNIFYDL